MFRLPEPAGESIEPGHRGLSIAGAHARLDDLGQRLVAVGNHIDLVELPHAGECVHVVPLGDVDDRAPDQCEVRGDTGAGRREAPAREGGDDRAGLGRAPCHT